MKTKDKVNKMLKRCYGYTDSYLSYEYNTILLMEVYEIVSELDSLKTKQPPLHQCPYDITCRCIMDEGCSGCETFAKYLVGDTDPVQIPSKENAEDKWKKQFLRCFHNEYCRKNKKQNE